MALPNMFRDLADRAEVNLKSFPSLTDTQINAHPGGHPNSIAWMLWHTGRVLDVNISFLSGNEQLWTASGYEQKFDLGPIGEGPGVGHTPEEAAEVKVDDLDLLVDYVSDTLDAYRAYIDTIESDEAFDEVIGEFKGAPDTRQARLTLIIVDALRHIDQSLYVAGMGEI